MTLTRSRSKTIQPLSKEELWLEECQNAYLELESNALDYIKLNVEKENQSWRTKLQTHKQTTMETKAKSEPHPQTTMETKTTMEKLAKMRLKPRQQTPIIQQQ